jgi:ABC-type branched-subunit amino acid transport system ATPase component
VLLLVLWLAPEGIVGEIRRRFGAAVPAHRAQDRVDVAGYITASVQQAALEARGLALSFGGVRAVSDVDFTARAGEVTSLIGPNGAGKTTLLNLLSGVYRPDAGIITLGAQPLTGRAAHVIARAGVARTFQTSQLFAGLSVLDNVRVGLRRDRLGSPLPFAQQYAASAEERRRAESLLVFVGYGDALTRSAGELAHIDKRLVEIARALATGPTVLLLDEPAAGLGADDKTRLRALLRRLAELGLAVVLIEHDMGLVMEVSDTVVVLDAGRRIAAGAPAEVQRDFAVLKELSVIDNLWLGATTRSARDAAAGIERMLARFPLLQARRAQRAGLLSGGEQQMLALARGLMAGPRVLLLDEPSLGLAPAAIAALFGDLAALRDESVTLLLVDQMAGPALALADRAYVIETGRIVRTGPAAEIAADDALRAAYLGGQAQAAN